MSFGTKNYLKSNRNHTAKHTNDYLLHCSWIIFFYINILELIIFFKKKKIMLELI
jgi:hypothetical protein